jgi:hypothetical protein
VVIGPGPEYADSARLISVDGTQCGRAQANAAANATATPMPTSSPGRNRPTIAPIATPAPSITRLRISSGKPRYSYSAKPRSLFGK